jgi:hypothetical protein
MSTTSPWFKFTVADWMTGDIVFESFSVQGLFINICAIYWQRQGNLTIADINKRYRNPIELTELVNRFIKTDNDGNISISFMDELLKERGGKSVINSKNGSEGGKKRAENLKAKKITDEALPATKPVIELIYPFDSTVFKEQWLVWKKYKKDQHKFTYKGDISEQAALKELGEMSGGDEKRAIELIHQSIANGWKGIFNKINNTQNGTTKQVAGDKNSIFRDAVREDFGNR